MQGLWTQKSLMVTQNQKHGISAQEQNDFCKETNKAHFKKMYEQKEYMEEYLKFKEVLQEWKNEQMNTKMTYNWFKIKE